MEAWGKFKKRTTFPILLRLSTQTTPSFLKTYSSLSDENQEAALFLSKALSPRPKAPSLPLSGNSH